MIKGGFQGLDISGLDLTAQSPTLPGGYAACAAADGKPIRVLTADGAVQCSVKKVSTNYVLAGITGDGKILSITIGSTDGITVAETEIPGDEEPNYRLGKQVQLNDYTSSNKFTCPADGVVLLKNNSNTETTSAYRIDVAYLSSMGSETYGAVLIMPSGVTSVYVASIPVRKGQKIYMTKVTPAAEEEGTPRGYFMPYETYES